MNLEKDCFPSKCIWQEKNPPSYAILVISSCKCNTQLHPCLAPQNIEEREIPSRTLLHPSTTRTSPPLILHKLSTPTQPSQRPRRFPPFHLLQLSQGPHGLHCVAIISYRAGRLRWSLLRERGWGRGGAFYAAGVAEKVGGWVEEGADVASPGGWGGG